MYIQINGMYGKLRIKVNSKTIEFLNNHPKILNIMYFIINTLFSIIYLINPIHLFEFIVYTIYIIKNPKFRHAFPLCEFHFTYYIFYKIYKLIDRAKGKRFCIKYKKMHKQIYDIQKEFLPLPPFSPEKPIVSTFKFNFNIIKMIEERIIRKKIEMFIYNGGTPKNTIFPIKFINYINYIILECEYKYEEYKFKGKELFIKDELKEKEIIINEKGLYDKIKDDELNISKPKVIKIKYKRVKGCPSLLKDVKSVFDGKFNLFVI